MTQLLDEYVTIKREINALQKRESVIREKILKSMDRNQSDILQNEYFKCTRRYNKRESICKNDIPDETWNRYKKISVFPVLIVKEQH